MTDEELKGLFETMQRETRGELVMVRQEVGAGFADVRQEFAAVQQEFVAVRQEIASVRREMSAGFSAAEQEFASVRQEMSAEFADVRQEMRNGFETVRQENAAEHVETRRHIDVMITGLDRRLEFVAEGVMAVDQKLDRRCDALGDQVDSGIAETQAMIRFSHAEIERRFGSTT